MSAEERVAELYKKHGITAEYSGELRRKVATAAEKGNRISSYKEIREMLGLSGEERKGGEDT